MELMSDAMTQDGEELIPHGGPEVWDEDPDGGPLFTLPVDTPVALLPSLIAISRKAHADGVAAGQRMKAAEIRRALDL